MKRAQIIGWVLIACGLYASLKGERDIAATCFVGAVIIISLKMDD